jgi:hypothetical protein
VNSYLDDMRIHRRQTRMCHEVLADAGCTCEPDFYIVDETHLRVEHEERWCLLAMNPGLLTDPGAGVRDLRVCPRPPAHEPPNKEPSQ